VHSTPLQSLLGGLGLVPPVHGLLILNGDVFGVSGFLHGAAEGAIESALGVLGLVLGGLVAGALDGIGPTTLDTSLTRIVISGLLVGIGTKLAKGCTSGHMICGISRLSLRSLVATATFCITGVSTARFMHLKALPPQGPMDWNLNSAAKPLIALQVLPLATEIALYFYAYRNVVVVKQTRRSRSFLRSVALIASSFSFALGLLVSNLTDPLKVVSFLVLPFHGSFDPSLAFLALGALPLMSILYRYVRNREQPQLGGAWSVPKNGIIDARLLFGAAIFGVGWGMEGICPGPALVNFGKALLTGRNLAHMAAWLGSVVAGGLLC